MPTASADVTDAWPVWRLVCEGVATLSEIQQHWTLENVYQANEALDWQADCVATWRHVTRQEAQR